MESGYPDITQRLAARLSALRTDLGLTIEELAVRSGVSRAMISKIERAESSPTAVVLNKLSIGLGVLLPTLFGNAGYREPRDRSPVARQHNQTQWRDPASGYRRRTLSPADRTHPLQLSEIRFPPGARVSFENAFGTATVHQQIWILQGRMEIRLGTQLHQLDVGDCMAMTLDQPITFHNPGARTARYVVATSSGRKIEP